MGGFSDERASNQSTWRFLAAVSAGNAFEWFDFVLYGYFASAIAKNFFPLENKAASLLVALAAFGVAFVMRPVGAVVLGRYGDQKGRKPALLVTLSLMTLGTAIIAVAPPYAFAGIAASALIVGGRLLQGFSAGGEFGSATAFLAEQNPNRRGFFTSLQFMGQTIAVVLATASGLILAKVLDAEQLLSWGWRIPFLGGLCIAPIAYHIRTSVPESPEFRATQLNGGSLRRIFSEAWTVLLIAIGLVVFLSVTVYALIFMPTFAVEKLGLPPYAGFFAALITGVLQAIIVPISGALSDRWGQASIGYAVIIGSLLAIYPLCHRMVATPTLESLLAFQIVIGALVAGYAGILPALMADLFPTHIRATGTSISYALAVSVFGGFAPFIIALSIELSGNGIALVYYLMFAALVSLGALTVIFWRGNLARG